MWTFTWQGQKVVFNDARDWTGNEFDAVEAHYGKEIHQLTKRQTLFATVEVSVRRVDPTVQFGSVPWRQIKAANDEVSAQQAEAEARAAEETPAVASPTSAGESGNEQPASAKGKRGNASTPRRSRTGSTSAPGKSDS
jgi:hypothetical protein